MKWIIAAFLLFSLPCMAQKIKVNETDKFTGMKRVQTSEEALLSKLTSVLRFYFRTNGTNYFMHFQGMVTGVGSVNPGDEMIMLLEDGSKVVVHSVSYQTYEVNRYGGTYDHQYSIGLDNLKALSMQDVVSIRRYTNSGYSDYEVPKKNQDKIKKAALLILNSL